LGIKYIVVFLILVFYTIFSIIFGILEGLFRLTKLAFLSISLITDPARGTSQLYLRVAWTSAFKQIFP